MDTKNILDTSINNLTGLPSEKAEILNKELGLFTYQDLLEHYPYKYVDKTKVYSIADIQAAGQYIQINGVLSELKKIGSGRKARLTGKLKDTTGQIELIWFKGINFLPKMLKPGNEYRVFGKPTVFGKKLNIAHPEMELLTHANIEQLEKIEPIYHTTEKMKKKGLDTKNLKKLIKQTLSIIQKHTSIESLTPEVIQAQRLIAYDVAIEQIHFPNDEQAILESTRRLKFEELFFIQLKLLNLKSIRSVTYKGFVFGELGAYFNTFYENYLTFELTGAQKKVLKEIRKDLLSGRQMNRLLQGDVGSGKTIVAVISMLMALDSQFQACMIAPTEILAQQHFGSVSELLKPMKVSVALLTGSTSAKDRKDLHLALQEGHIQILIGTHAVLEDKVQFNNLGLVVIDEQHRFGVAQRAKLWKKNTTIPPHVLVMTATPIPRTLAMTLYADLDVSVIDELPPGRKPIKTVHKTDAQRLRVFGFMREQIALGRQVYVVYPLIQESETLDYKDLMDGYESIVRAFPLPDYQVSIVHGQMKNEDKEYEMQRFVKGETQIMVATTVIEVGVNVPNASVMIIESAERFGLSQLHQLRGRVGRGADQSYCILMSGNKKSNEARERIKTMVETNDGFRIAEVDLKLRGPGEIDGVQQSGSVNLKLADLVKDGALLRDARTMAQVILEEDPLLDQPQNKLLKKTLQRKTAGKNGWSKIS